MNLLRRIIIGFGMAILGGLLILGCAVEPVRVDLPVSHPANPEAEEAAFAPPPNPLMDADTMAGYGYSGGSDAMMIRENHDSESRAPMEHQTDHGNMKSPAGREGGQQKEKGADHGAHH